MMTMMNTILLFFTVFLLFEILTFKWRLFFIMSTVDAFLRLVDRVARRRSRFLGMM